MTRRKVSCLLDTHVLLRATFSESCSGRQAAKAINLASREDRIAISAITPREIALPAARRQPLKTKTAPGKPDAVSFN
ncbi:MAG TPA: hypothetical protein VKU93_10725 [Terracidiphilus sp.]|nr:hypothetical protein [Terracidiphilus sp.]